MNICPHLVVFIKNSYIRVGYPSRRIRAEVFVATVVHHLVEGEGEVRGEDTLADILPRVGSGRSVISDDLV